jgi:hypothetical protein
MLNKNLVFSSKKVNKFVKKVSSLQHISGPLQRVFLSVLLRTLENENAPESGRLKANELLRQYFPELAGGKPWEL